jgi:hypothetical protein
VDNFYLERGMTDRELLELAAKAAGYDLYFATKENDFCSIGPCYTKEWNPLTDDGDALRLAVDLMLEIYPCGTCTIVEDWEPQSVHISVKINDSDPYAATRRAIVRAAAEIGKELA